MVDAKKNMAASVRQRLKNLAREKQRDFGVVLVSYGLERLIYRLSISSYRDNFVLKGGMLITAWAINDSRNTRDADFLGFGDLDEGHLKAVFTEILSAEVGDGLVFDTDQLTASTIREDQIYGGVRLKTTAHLDNVRIPVTIDIGLGDAITEPDHLIDYPSLLDLPIAKIRAYPPETVIAEKFQAIVALGVANGRMKDYYDLWAISSAMPVDAVALDAAISATFKRRETAIPSARPPGLTAEFFNNPQKVEQWAVYAGSIDLDGVSLEKTVDEIWNFIGLSCQRLTNGRENEPFA